MAKITKRQFDTEERAESSIRINKYLSDCGVCSRREADAQIEKGNVTIDGERAVMGSKVEPGQTVMFNGKKVAREEKMVLIALNKPRGIVCTTDRKDPDNIIDFIKYSQRIYPIGRLDKDSDGLILLTNNGDIVNKILRAGNNHEKEYVVTVNKALTPTFVRGMSEGVPILDTVTKPCSIEVINRTSFKIILTQGLNRQIRRMCEYFGYRVVTLTRVRIMNVNLGHLHVGGYRNLTDRELDGLKDLIAESQNAPVSGDIDEEMMDVRVSSSKINDRSKTAAFRKKQHKSENFTHPKKDSDKTGAKKDTKRFDKPEGKNYKKPEGKSYTKPEGKSYSKSGSSFGNKSGGRSSSLGKDAKTGSRGNSNAGQKAKNYRTNRTSR